MLRFNRAIPIVATIILPFALGGCPALVVGGLAAAGGVGYTAAQERGVNGTVDDFTVKTNIETSWVQANPSLQENLTVTVYQGRTLLTGTAPSPQMRAQAEQLARTTPGVTAVYDEIAVGPGESNWAVAKDAWITARLRSELVLDADVRSVNYTIDTSDQSVFLIGSARTQAELDRATQIARYIPDVKRVVSYVEIRPGSPMTARAAPPPPVGGPSPGYPAGAPSAPVEVQKL